MDSASSSQQPSAANVARASAGNWPHLRSSGEHNGGAHHGQHRLLPHALLGIVLVIATAGLVYELVIAAVASYVLGDSVRQFSMIIGVYLSAMGLGAYLSRSIESHLELVFVDVELAAALIGGLSAPLLFIAFSFTQLFQLILYSTVVLVGVLVGLELPLLIRILKRDFEFKDLIAKSLTFDYAGALLGSLAFSLVLMPELGLVRASLLCGLLNASAALLAIVLLSGRSRAPRRKLQLAKARAALILIVLLVAFTQAESITRFAETANFEGRIVIAQSSPYQRTLLVSRAGDHELYLNGHLQFSSRDEHRYHEALVHPAMSSVASPRRVLIGGGGDGLAAREVLKWPTVASVLVVDLDPAVTSMASSHEVLTKLNRHALSDPRVRILNRDAMVAFSELEPPYDVILLDFPDPSNYSLGKLYSQRFYRSVYRLLAPHGALAVQSTSPQLARRAFWCVVTTLESVGFFSRPYHVFLPSFGDWGYVLATKGPPKEPSELPPALRYLDGETFAALFALPADTARVPTRVNRLVSQALVSYYLDEWGGLD